MNPSTASRAVSSVPAEVHLTPDQIQIQSLQRSTALRLSLTAIQLRALCLEENLLCLRPIAERSLAELARLNHLGELMLRLQEQVDQDEKNERWLETVWWSSVEHEKKRERGERDGVEKEPVFQWSELRMRWE